MASNQSAGDFGCCGSWYFGCALGKGCMYCSCLKDPDERMNAIIHASKHCNLFHEIYIKKDQEVIKKWRASAERAIAKNEWAKANPEEAKKQWEDSIKARTTTTRSETTKVLKEAEALLKALGLK